MRTYFNSCFYQSLYLYQSPPSLHPSWDHKTSIARDAEPSLVYVMGLYLPMGYNNERLVSMAYHGHSWDTVLVSHLLRPLL